MLPLPSAMYCATHLYGDSKIHPGRSAKSPTNETQWLTIKTATKLNHRHLFVTSFYGLRASIPSHPPLFPPGCESGTPVLTVFTLLLKFAHIPSIIILATFRRLGTELDLMVLATMKLSTILIIFFAALDAHSSPVPRTGCTDVR